MSAEPCSFCQIASGEIEAEVVFDDEASLGFLDHRPLFPGHLLLIPKRHYGSIADLPPAAVGPLFSTVQLLSRAVESALGCEGTFIALNNRVSQSVPHLHVHVVPRTKGDGLKGFFWPRHRYSGPEHMASVRESIKRAVASLAAEED